MSLQCLETGSDEPMKRYELIIEIECSISRLHCSIGWRLENISEKNCPKRTEMLSWSTGIAFNVTLGESPVLQLMLGHFSNLSVIE